MLQFVNDSPEDARHLASFLQPLNDKYKVCVNLIPYNDMGHPTFQRSSRERVNAFQVSGAPTCCWSVNLPSKSTHHVGVVVCLLIVVRF